MEVDRVLRPGGYWVLSGPPINWKANYQAWQRTKEDLEAEQKKIEEIAELFCLEKYAEIREIAIWRKRINADSCPGRQDEPSVKICDSVNDCKMKDILLEMDRILRPEGTVLFHDDVDALVKIKKMTGGMRWNSMLIDHEDGPLVPKKILVAVKQYWVAGEKNTTMVASSGAS
ncbi:putative methyltransferase PMT2 [Apostasia shenzhenica]|uniref:Methyltransferase n=1 Tax=Apostasia shenzhenica TaxID=1088818 RepID=A0A2I0AMG3_9ASPA|nr:putative methyltransferase PMT2 [Apostasia shenzhenica]